MFVYGTLTVLALACAVGLVQTGQLRYVGGLVVLGLCGGGWMIADWLIESDEERIAARLALAAEAVERNDVAAVVALLEPGRDELARRIETAMSPFFFKTVRITDERLQLSRVASPPLATTHIVVRASGALRREGMRIEQGYASLDIGWVKTPAGWRIRDYRLVKLDPWGRGG